MQVFEVLISLETRRLTGDTIGTLIQPDRAYLLVDDESTTIYIYKGPQCRWVFALIAERLAREIRMHMRGFYQIEYISLDHFAEIAGHAAVASGKIVELVNPDLYSPEDMAEIMQQRKVHQIKQESAWRERMQFADYNVFIHTKPKEILETINEQIFPAGFTRDMVLINNAMYSKDENIVRVLPKSEKEAEFTKLGNLPEGRFFLPFYTPRIYVHKGSVKAVEFFKPAPQASTPQVGEINIDVLPFERIQQHRDFSILKSAFKVPKRESLEMFLQKENTET